MVQNVECRWKGPTAVVATARRLKSEYLNRLEEAIKPAKEEDSTFDNKVMAVNKLEIQQKGRPLLLDTNLDVAVQEYIQSLRMAGGVVKRKCSTSGKIPMLQFEELKVFLADLAVEVVMKDIPKELTLNWDQTGVSTIPTDDWTMEKEGASFNSSYRRQEATDSCFGGNCCG